MRTFAEKPKISQQVKSPKSSALTRSYFGHSHEVNSILHSQRTIENQALQGMLRSQTEDRNAGLVGTTSTEFGQDFSQNPISPATTGAIQAKLAINKPRDEYEQQADRIAEQVLRMPEPGLRHTRAGGGGSPKYQANQSSQLSSRLQTKSVATESTQGTIVPAIAREVTRSIADGGQPLTDAVRSYFEPRFGRDFSHVRVHTNRSAGQVANSLNARAFTLGNHIVFGPRQYAPHSAVGRGLLAHELVHVMQQSGGENQPSTSVNSSNANGVIYRKKHEPAQAGAPDIAVRGYYTFYLPKLARGGRSSGFVARFTMIDDTTNTASVKVLYQPTQNLREFQFRLPPNQILRPHLLQQNVNAATFDLTGDGKGNLEILLLASSNTQGIRVYITQPGHTIGTYVIPPPQTQNQYVPNRGYLMGTLPNGKQYYLQPGTSQIPGGPFFVDEDGMRVSPGLEFRAKAIQDAATKAYLYSYAALLAIAGGAYVLPALAENAVVAGTVTRGAGVIRWLFSGTRLIAGGSSAAANLATQALEHGAEWKKYNWGSVGFDYVMGAISYSVVKSVITRWPAPLFTSQIGSLQTWLNFGKQQTVLALYGTIVGIIRSHVSNTKTGATVGAQQTEGVIQMAKSVALQSFLATPAGRSLFPAGYNDPRIAFISRTLTFITKLAVREVFNVVPQSSQSQAPAQHSSHSGH